MAGDGASSTNQLISQEASTVEAPSINNLDFKQSKPITMTPSMEQRFVEQYQHEIRDDIEEDYSENDTEQQSIQEEESHPYDGTSKHDPVIPTSEAQAAAGRSGN